MIRAYLFALDPTERQDEAMRSHCGAARVAYNWCLAQVRANWAQRAAGESYGTREAERTLWINTPAYNLRKALCTGARVVGIDWGMSTLAVLSTGAKIPNPRHLHTPRRRPRCAQRTCARRHGPDRRIRQEPSNRWRKARARADRLHTRVTNLRRDGIHQFTTQLVLAHDIIAVDDLHVAGMLRDERSARHIADAGWAEVRRRLTYKTERAGVRLVVAERWFASGKTCSGCGTAKAELPLSVRTFVCMKCGIVLDRDENAARNLAALAARDEHDTGELRREQTDRTDTAPAQRAARAVGPLREESSRTQRRRREAVSARALSSAQSQREVRA